MAATLVMAVWVSSVSAQISAGGTPPSFSLSLTSAVPVAQMAPVDPLAYLAEDAQAPKDEPYRFAANLDVSLNLNNSGVWDNVPGGRLWRLQIASPGAYSLCLLYDQWYIPDGGELFIYNEDRSQIIGAFTSFNNWVDGTNITQHVAGDLITVEYFEPDAVAGLSVLSISQVAHAYRNLFGRPDALENFGDSGSCNNNVNCPVGADWQTNKRGVAMIMSGGSRICTGSLINNVNQDHTPYFLTANHCLGGSNSWVFVFNYESPSCSNVDGPTNQTVANSTLRANYSASDFALLQLSSNVPANYNPYFNGWNRVDSPATNSTCIHHPSGDIKKISFDYNAPISDTWSGTPANSHWRIAQWDDGTTEPGSSGSPLFDQNHRITGQLHGGQASCSFNYNDYYGKFAMSWAYGGSASTRLRDWLDPGNTGVNTLDGLDGAAASITVTSPNGGENWIEGTSQNITWTSSNLTGNVNIELNRTYPGGAWEAIALNTANDGAQSWTVTLPATSLARIRITSVDNGTVSDISNSNFTIAARTVTVTSPNGGENWLEGTGQSITWTSANLTGNVNIELNRTYPGGAWEPIAMNTANDGTQLWLVTTPATTSARVRVTSVNYGTVNDVSDGNFTIVSSNTPPAITHDPLDDQFTEPFTVTALVTDNAGGVVTKFFFWHVGGGPIDSAVMNATGNPDEVAATIGPLTADSYGYYLQARDIGGLVTVTDSYFFQVGAACGTEQAYDDGNAEASHWSYTTPYRWAVKFNPPAIPYAICSGRIGISAFNPDTTHSLIEVRVYAADGVGGLPGTLLFSGYIGSIGNIIGGVPTSPDNWATVVLRDGNGDPLFVDGSFYFTVSNPTPGSYESFLQDQSSAYAGHSYVYDPCDSTWYNENSGQESARLGNRMIRASGFPLVPPVVVIHRSGNDIVLNWQANGAPYYRIFSDTDPNGAFTDFEGSTSGTSFTDVGPLGTIAKFYLVKASTAP